MKTSTFSNAIIWFGAAVSVAEIATGVLIAPLGLEQGLLAVLIGHAIGCVPLFFAGLIGAKTGLCAMDAAKLSFGRGSGFFATLNIVQLTGWTAVMITGGGSAAALLSGTPALPWYIAIGALIALWLLLAGKPLRLLSALAVAALFVLTIALSAMVFGGEPRALPPAGLTFGAAVELSAAMPISWLPLIADYTSRAKHGKRAASVSVLVYFVVSCWMFIIGLGVALYAGAADVAEVMSAAGMGIAGVVVIIFSTVTTTYLDAFSAAESFVSLFGRWRKAAGVVACAIGTALACLMPTGVYEGFLYLISSVFAPMIAIQIADCFILKKSEATPRDSIMNFVIWAAGFALCRIYISLDTPIGSTLPIMLTVCAVSAGAKALARRLAPAKQS